jgi:hypothetical protein
MDKKKLSIAESLYKDGKTNVSEICKTLGIAGGMTGATA